MKLCPAWPAESLVNRLLGCQTMLNLHGCLRDREYRKVRLRIARLEGRLDRERQKSAKGTRMRAKSR